MHHFVSFWWNAVSTGRAEQCLHLCNERWLALVNCRIVTKAISAHKLSRAGCWVAAASVSALINWVSANVNSVQIFGLLNTTHNLSTLEIEIQPRSALS